MRTRRELGEVTRARACIYARLMEVELDHNLVNECLSGHAVHIVDALDDLPGGVVERDGNERSQSKGEKPQSTN